MHRTVAALVAIALVLGCTPRPARRRGDVVGAPALNVASEGDPSREVATPERQQELAAARALEHARQKLTVEGVVRRSSADTVVLQPERGRALSLAVRPLFTHVSMDARPLTSAGVPEGAKVRASYVAEAGSKVAESIEILEVPAVAAESRRIARTRGGPRR